MFVVKRSHHNPILVPDKNNYWEAFASFNMSVIKKEKMFYGVYRAISAIDRLRTPQQVSIIGIGKSKAVKIRALLMLRGTIIYFIQLSLVTRLKPVESKSQSLSQKI